MMLNVREVAKLLNVSEKKIYRLITQNNVPYYKIGDEYRFNHVELLEWATKMGIKVSPDTVSDNEQNQSGGISFLDALETGGIFYNIPGNDKVSVIRAIVNSMNLPQNTDREFLFEVLLAREKLGSTGVGEGIAIPHVRHPIIVNGTKAIVTLCFLQNSIDFNAPDGLPVKTLFTLITPSIRVHLALLSKLGLVLQSKSFKEAINKQASPDIIKSALKDAEAVGVNKNCGSTVLQTN